MSAFSNRYELKYVIDLQTYFKIKREISQLFKYDSSAGDSGKYGITSVYFDTANLDFFWEKIDGEENRIKIRLRTYSHNSLQTNGKNKQEVFLEIKKKKNKNIYKKRV